MKAEVMFNTSHIDRIEKGIAPPHALVVTIPIQAMVKGKRVEGFTLYVSSSPFAPKVSVDQFKAVVDAVVEQLEAREG